jgi:putative cardiolipin synthase
MSKASTLAGAPARIGSATHRTACAVLAGLALAACAGLPPGADYPRVATREIVPASETRAGRALATLGLAHGEQSGFRIITAGIDGLVMRVQMIDAAERSIDLQYFIYRSDRTGRRVTAALRRAVARGVRVRVLVDDADLGTGGADLLALDGQQDAQVRVFNPFAYRGPHMALRVAEFLFNQRRLDYRMHNKLLVADGTAALMGGRNIGEEYFQLDPRLQVADDDVFVAGPVAAQLDGTFYEYWNSPLAIPAAALRKRRAGPAPAVQEPLPYEAAMASGEPYAGMLAGTQPLVWARALLVYDSPEKRRVIDGERRGRLLNPELLAVLGATQHELLMITPYVVPAAAELQLLQSLRQRQVQVRILTNSLEGAPGLFAQSGYMRVRPLLLREGVELHESRALLGSVRGSGQSARIARFGNYALHAKLFVVDGSQLFVGSMNFDQRSQGLNTEVGLVIDSPELAAQTAQRFAGMTELQNAYAVRLLPGEPGDGKRIAWVTMQSGKEIALWREPARNEWRRAGAWLFSLLPFGREQ